MSGNMAELLIVGCSAGSPNAGMPASGYVVFVAENRPILLDCGAGVVAGLTKYNKELAKNLAAVIVSHKHADHCADLVALAYHRLFPTPLPPLKLYAPQSVQQTIQSLDDVFGIPTLEHLRAPLSQAFDFSPIADAMELQIAGTTVKTHRTIHPVETLALHFSDLGLAYTADAALTPALQQFVTGANTLLAEATYTTAEGHDLLGHGHLTASQAGELAKNSQVARLILTHLSDSNDRQKTLELAKAVFSGEALCAAPELKISLRNHMINGIITL